MEKAVSRIPYLLLISGYLHSSTTTDQHRHGRIPSRVTYHISLSITIAPLLVWSQPPFSFNPSPLTAEKHIPTSPYNKQNPGLFSRPLSKNMHESSNPSPYPAPSAPPPPPPPPPTSAAPPAPAYAPAPPPPPASHPPQPHAPYPPPPDTYAQQQQQSPYMSAPTAPPPAAGQPPAPPQGTSGGVKKSAGIGGYPPDGTVDQVCCFHYCLGSDFAKISLFVSLLTNNTLFLVACIGCIDCQYFLPRCRHYGCGMRC